MARQRRNHDVESVRRGAAMCRRIGQRIDDLQLLDDRAGPSVRDDHRQRVRMLRTHVNEMDVHPVDLGHELRQGVELRLALAPVVVRRPVVRELLHRRQLDALRLVRDGFLLGPARGGDAAIQVGERLVREVNVKGADSRGDAVAAPAVVRGRGPLRLCPIAISLPREVVASVASALEETVAAEIPTEAVRSTTVKR